MNDIIYKAFSWLKGLAIVNFGLKALKQLWPFLVALIFWPEIDALLGDIFPFWDKYMATVSSYIMQCSDFFRTMPILEPFFEWLDEFIFAIKHRIMGWL